MSDFSPTLVAELKELMGRYPDGRSALLPMLHLLQSAEGRVTTEGINLCAELLHLTSAEVSGVATFYTMYKRRPMGQHHVGVCTNTLCAVMGGDEIFDSLCGRLGIGNDETTEDGKITLERVECNAACDNAPVVMVNWEFFDYQTPESAMEVIDKLRADETVTSTRGATITSWREAERVIAGFEDGRADEGPGAGPASLVGLEIANDKGWKAPKYPDALDRPSGGAGPRTDNGSASKEQAASEADTRRAESETVAETSAADTRGGGADESGGAEPDPNQAEDASGPGGGSGLRAEDGPGEESSND